MPDPNSTDSTRTVALPEEVVDAIERRLPRTRFDSADAYAAFALERLLREVQRETTDGDAPDGSEAVRDRLESLGYL